MLRVVLNLLYSRDFKDVPFTTSGFGIILKHTSGDFIIATCLPFLDVASLERERVSQVTSGHPFQTFPRGGCGGQRREIPAPGADAPTALARCWTGGGTRRIRHAMRAAWAADRGPGDSATEAVSGQRPPAEQGRQSYSLEELNVTTRWKEPGGKPTLKASR